MKTLKTKLLLTFLISSFFLFGLAGGSEASNMGPLTVHPTNPRYFADGNGKATYLTGSHTWYIFQDWKGGSREAFDFDDFIDFLKINNHNFVRGWICKSTYIPWDKDEIDSPYQRTGVENAWDGKPKVDLYAFNESYFIKLRERVKKMGDNGIYVSMMMFWDTAKLGGKYWDSHIFNKANNIQRINGDFNSEPYGREIYNLDSLKAGNIPERLEILELHEVYVRKIIDTLGDLDNIIWEVGNEMNKDTVSFQNYFIDYIRDYEKGKPKQHMVGFTFVESSIPNVDLFKSSADWISPHDPLGDLNSGYSFNPPANDGSKVILSDTDHLAKIVFPANSYPERYRQWAWKSFTRGINAILMDDMQSPAVDNAVHPLYDEVLALSPARKYLGDILRYAERVDLALMTPQGSLSSTKYCLANPGSQYIIYQPDSGQFSVNLFAGTYNYEWFNPTTGAVKGSGTINAPNGNKNFIPPFNGDAVLYLSVSGTAVIPKLIPRDYWSVIYVTSEETDIREKKSAEKVFDGVIETRWAARWPPNRTVPPHPQEIVIDIGESYKISGFRYLPRQDFHDGAWQPSGTIADYKFYVSNNKDNWGAPVASGTFSKSGEEKQILFPEKEGRYFRLIALSEVNGNDGTVVSELNLIGTDADGCLTYEICNNKDDNCNGQVDETCDQDNDDYCGCDMVFEYGANLTNVCPNTNTSNDYWWYNTCDCNDSSANINPNAIDISDDGIDNNCDGDDRNATINNSTHSKLPQNHWRLLDVDSEELFNNDPRPPYQGSKAFDGVVDTYWGTEWVNNDPPHPHYIKIDLGKTYFIDSFSYLPKQCTQFWWVNGMIADYKFYVSEDPNSWGVPAAEGTFNSNQDEKKVLFAGKKGRYIYLQADSEFRGEDFNITTVSELNVLGHDIGAASLPLPDPTCGDGDCNGTETCSDCPADCGECSVPDPLPTCVDDLGGKCCNKFPGQICGGTVVPSSDCTNCCLGTCSFSGVVTCTTQGFQCCTNGCQSGYKGYLDCPAAGEVCCEDCYIGGGIVSPPENINIKNPVKTSIFAKIIENTLMWSLSIIGSLALLMLIIGGVMYIGSAGDEQKVLNAKKIVTYAILGTILILVSYSIVKVLSGVLS